MSSRALATYPLTLVDVFAARPLEGNLLAVVHDADRLSLAAMRTIARRMRLSETSFLQRSPDPGADYRHRIFTVEDEIPFAGHPSLGSAAAHAYRLGQRRGEYVQLTTAGLQPVTVDLDADGNGTARMRQNDAALGAIVEVPDLPAALGLERTTLHPRLPVQLVSTGLPTLIVPLRDPRALRAISVEWPLFAAALSPVGGPPLNCYVVAPSRSGVWRARCFATDIAGGEDPATGSAVGPLAAYLQHHLGLDEVVVEQGVEMGAPSRLAADVRDGIVVSGRVWLRGSGQLRIP